MACPSSACLVGRDPSMIIGRDDCLFPLFSSLNIKRVRAPAFRSADDPEMLGRGTDRLGGYCVTHVLVRPKVPAFIDLRGGTVPALEIPKADIVQPRIFHLTRFHGIADVRVSLQVSCLVKITAGDGDLQ